MRGDPAGAAYRLIPYLSAGLLAFLIVVFIYALVYDLRVMDRWLERPYLFVFPRSAPLPRSLWPPAFVVARTKLPFPMVITHFRGRLRHARNLVLAVHDPVLASASSGCGTPHSSLAFMFWGAGLFVFPLMLAYTAINLSVFRGKVTPTTDHY